MNNKNNESVENYLETILMLSNDKPAVRSIDLAMELEFSKASVSIAMKHLKEKDYVQVDGSGYITLTKEGLKIAKDVYERHQLLTHWLVTLGVDETIAAEDACRIEHVISPESIAAIKKHIK